MPAIYRQIQIKVIPQGAAADRPIGEMRQALTLFLSAVSRDLEGKLKRSTPADTGRSPGGLVCVCLGIRGSRRCSVFHDADTESRQQRSHGSCTAVLAAVSRSASKQAS